MSSVVLAASAVLAALKRERGGEVVAAAIANAAVISAVNVAEVVSRLADWGMDEATIHATLDPLDLQVLDFDADLAYAAGLLRPRTRQFGLSLGDRACLVLARRLGAEALTADRTWAQLPQEFSVRIVR